MGKKILSVGHMQFPLGQAQVQRQLLMAKALVLEGFDVTVLCRYGIHKKEDNIPPEGTFEGIHYIYCSGTSIRPGGFLKRNILKIKGLLNEINFYRRCRNDKDLKGALISTNRFYNIVFYFLIGRIYGFMTIVDNVEHWTSNKDFRGLIRLDKLLYDRFYYYFADKIICISDYLIDKIKVSGARSVVKIPAITDFEKFSSDGVASGVNGKYMLYCASKAYYDVIEFVIEVFETLDRKDINLVIVTNSTGNLEKRISRSRISDQIIIRENVPYDSLVSLYKQSEGLLIPMRINDQDKARFPHKISEYCAARRPIITNNVGEIGNYFNNSNSFLCPVYDTAEYAAMVNQVLSDPLTSKIRADESYRTGLIHFNYRTYSKVLAKMYMEL